MSMQCKWTVGCPKRNSCPGFEWESEIESCKVLSTGLLLRFHWRRKTIGDSLLGSTDEIGQFYLFFVCTCVSYRSFEVNKWSQQLRSHRKQSCGPSSGMLLLNLCLSPMTSVNPMVLCSLRDSKLAQTDNHIQLYKFTEPYQMEYHCKKYLKKTLFLMKWIIALKIQKAQR